MLALAVVAGGCLTATTIECSGLPNVYVNGGPLVIRGNLPDIIVVGGFPCGDDCDDD
jgi:hypothetical protein